jgi:superoxide dismutase
VYPGIDMLNVFNCDNYGGSVSHHASTPIVYAAGSTYREPQCFMISSIFQYTSHSLKLNEASQMALTFAGNGWKWLIESTNYINIIKLDSPY